jgi:hypothetical protein
MEDAVTEQFPRIGEAGGHGSNRAIPQAPFAKISHFGFGQGVFHQRSAAETSSATDPEATGQKNGRIVGMRNKFIKDHATDVVMYLPGRWPRYASLAEGHGVHDGSPFAHTTSPSRGPFRPVSCGILGGRRSGRGARRAGRKQKQRHAGRPVSMFFCCPSPFPLQPSEEDLVCHTGTPLFREGDRVRAAQGSPPAFEAANHGIGPTSPATLSGVSAAGRESVSHG